ncbi:uncharacterized protein LOC131008409 [Salvia miltiorrhiza]|uniref:uncharacterized protein LOC131008409 n=1 Tax=Salvia miltiorrhiza TaxID=226208 RepID=UPI0025ABD6D2|nr:uncharacterized protein LOC131008409 [Salvia miltiorrhiza]
MVFDPAMQLVGAVCGRGTVATTASAFAECCCAVAYICGVGLGLPVQSFWNGNAILGYVLDAKEYKFVLTTPAPANPTARSSDEQREVHKRWHSANNMAKAYIMTTMSSALQLQHQSMETAASIMKNLEDLFGESDRSVRFEIMRKLMSSKMLEGSSVREHVLGMIHHFNELDLLGGGIANDTKVDMVIYTLPKFYENF